MTLSKLVTIARGISNQKKKIKPGNTKDFVSGGRDVIKLNTDGGWQKYLMLRWKGNAVFPAAADNVRANIKPGDEGAVLTNIRIIMFGKSLWDGSWEELRAMQRVWFGRDAVTTPTLGDAAATNVAFDTTLVFPFVDLECARPYDTLNDGRNVGDARVELTFGTKADLSSGNITSVAGTISAELYNMYGYAGLVDQKRHTRNTAERTGAGELICELDIFGQSIISHLLHIEDPTTGNDLANVVTKISIENGGDDPIEIEGEELRQFYNLCARTTTDLLQTTADLQYFADPYRSAGSDSRSWIYLPHVDPVDKLATESYDTTGTQVLRIRLTVTQSARLTVLSTIREPDPKAALAQPRAA